MLALRSIAMRTGAALFAIATSGASAAPAPVGWEPDPRGGTGWIEDGTWIDEGPGYGIRLRLVNEAERLAYLERATGHRIDPFATPPDRQPRYLSFLLELANSGSSALELQAQSAWLHAGASGVLSPVGIEGLSSAARTLELELGEAYERTRPAVLESSISVAPGGSVAGLLVYRRFEPNTKRFRIEMQFTLPNGELARFIAPYRRTKSQPGERTREPGS